MRVNGRRKDDHVRVARSRMIKVCGGEGVGDPDGMTPRKGRSRVLDSRCGHPPEFGLRAGLGIATAAVRVLAWPSQAPNEHKP